MTIEHAPTAEVDGNLTLSPAMWTLVLAVVGGALAARLFGHAAPSQLGTDLALAGAVAAGMTIGWAVRHKAPLNTGGPIAWGLAIALFAFFALSDGYFWALDLTLGTPAQRPVVITGWSSGGGRRSGADCSHFNVDGDGFVINPTACADGRYSDEAIPGRHLVLIGRATPLGMAVESWRLGPRP